MTIKNTLTTYGSVAKFLHWLIFLLLFFMIIYGYFLPDIPKTYQAMAYNIHKVTGVLILCLMLLRGFWALINPRPLLASQASSFWERVIERIVHYLLYVAVIAMPLSGWIGSSSAGKAPHVGGFVLQLPIAHHKALIKGAFEIHNFLALAIIVLVSLHFIAALYHYFIKKDEILQRMLPSSRHY